MYPRTDMSVIVIIDDRYNRMRFRVLSPHLVIFIHQCSSLTGIIPQRLQCRTVHHIILLVPVFFLFHCGKRSLHKTQFIKPEERRSGIPHIQKSRTPVISYKLHSKITGGQRRLIRYPILNVRASFHLVIKLFHSLHACLYVFRTPIRREILRLVGQMRH